MELTRTWIYHSTRRRVAVRRSCIPCTPLDSLENLLPLETEYDTIRSCVKPGECTAWWFSGTDLLFHVAYPPNLGFIPVSPLPYQSSQLVNVSSLKGELNFVSHRSKIIRWQRGSERTALSSTDCRHNCLRWSKSVRRIQGEECVNRII